MKNINFDPKTNKSFSLTFGIVLFFINLYVFFYHELNLSLIIITSLFFLILLININNIQPLNYVWFKIGIFLGKIISPLILSIIYFSILFITYLYFFIFEKIKNFYKKKSKKSFWIINKDKKVNFNRLF